MSRESKKREWAVKVEQWLSSGKSAKAWCSANNISYQTFLYWAHSKKKLEKMLPSRPSFIELKSPLNKSTGIFLEVEGVRIEILPDFDQTTLKRCLQTLKGIVC